MTLEVRDTFNERVQEINDYFNFLKAIDTAIKHGSPQIEQGSGSDNFIITVTHQKILYSSVYLQLYNLIEAIMIKGLEAISSEVTNSLKPTDLSRELYEEWVKFEAKTSIELGFDKRFIAALSACDLIMRSVNITDFKVEKGGGGNWEDKEIEKRFKKLGLKIKISSTISKNVKKHFRDGEGYLCYVKTLRNKLAHGNTSFTDSGANVTYDELLELKERVVDYVEGVVVSFEEYIDNKDYMRVKP